MAVSKKTRFTVFERDAFACRYCGKTPMDHGVILEVDHAISKKEGGSDDEDNLVTSCFDCNRGKSRKSVTPPIDIKKQLKSSKDQLEQVRAMTALISTNRKIKNKKEEWIEELVCCYSEALISQMKKAVRTATTFWLPIVEIVDSVEITMAKFEEYEEFLTRDFVKYFYGVVRNKIK